jgi:phage host-nuclease inhibitor protein Gam
VTATLDEVTKKSKPAPTAEERAAEEMVHRAREQSLSLTGPDGLLKQLAKTVFLTVPQARREVHKPGVLVSWSKGMGATGVVWLSAERAERCGIRMRTAAR